MSDEERARTRRAAEMVMSRLRLAERLDLDAREYETECHEIADEIDTALAAERERCARACERIGSSVDGTLREQRNSYWQERTRAVVKTADDCAAAIRALSASEETHESRMRAAAPEMYELLREAFRFADPYGISLADDICALLARIDTDTTTSPTPPRAGENEGGSQ